MAGPLAKLYATLGLDTRDFDKGITKTESKTKSFVGDFKTQFKSGLGIGAGFSAGALAFNAVSDAASAAIGYVSDAINLASDWEEANSKVSVVFGDMAGEIEDFAKTGARMMGMSERAVLEATGTFGNFTQALGISRDESIDMSKAMVQLAADIGSFNNVASDEVLVALRSGLAGEAEPLRRFGVSISAARVEANILAKGIVKTKDAITDSMRVAERYAIIMEDTALAQGDFARTGDGFANTMKTIEAELENAQTQIGRALLPTVLKLALVFRDVVVPAIVQAADALDDLSAPIKDIVDAYNGLQKTVKENTGRDIGNDFANFVRIVATGGAALAVDGIDDVQRGLQRWSEGADIFAATGVDAFAKVSDGIGDMQDIANRELGAWSDMVVEPPDIADPMAGELDKTEKVIKKGFGNIKEALANPPQLISDTQRIRNLQSKWEKVNKNLRRAVAVGDTAGIKYWSAAVKSIQARQENLRHNNLRATEDIGDTNQKVGRKVRDIWTKSADKQGEQARRGANKAISEGQRIKTSLDAMDLVSTGKNLMLELAQGIGEGTQSVVDAASLAAQAIARAFGSVGPIGATAGGAIQSNGITIAGNVYGGPAGLRQLNDEVTKATRPTRRHRG